MKIALGTDHAGYELKERIKQYLIEKGHEVKDFGTYSAESCDYPDFIYPAALAVAKGECDRAIVMGGSGNGETIVANKVRGIRCAICWSEEGARLSRAHNDANAISIGAWTVSPELALKMIDIWLDDARSTAAGTPGGSRRSRPSTSARWSPCRPRRCRVCRAHLLPSGWNRLCHWGGGR